MTPSEARQIMKAIGRVRRRLWAQAVVRWFLLALVLVSVLALVTVVLHQAWILPLSAHAWIPRIALGIVSLGVLVGLIRQYDAIDLAQRLDRANNLKDRIATALELISKSPDERTEIENAQIRDAMGRLAGVSYKDAAPWKFPKRSSLAVLMLFALSWGATFFKVEPPSAIGAALPPVFIAESVPPATRIAVQESRFEPDVEATQDIEERIEENLRDLEPLAEHDPKAAKFVEELNKTLQKLAEGSVTDREVSKIAAELDKQLDELAGDKKEQEASEEFAEKLKDVGKELEKQSKKIKQKDLQDLGKMLDDGRFEEAAKQIEKLASIFNMLPKSMQKRLAKMFEKLARKYQSKLAGKLDKMRKERSRLNRKAQQGKLSKNEKRRLNRLNKKLDNLERKYGNQNSPARKQLDRLTRNIRDVADQLRRRNDKKQSAKSQSQGGPKGRSQRMSPEALKKLMNTMKKAGQQQRRRRLARKGKMRVADLKEMLRRRQQQGRRALKQLDRLARGRSGKKRISQGNGKKQPDSVQWMRSDKSALSKQRMNMGKANVGEGAGQGRKRMLMGKRTDLKRAKTKKSFVAGQKGRGPSKKEILYGAAEQGTRVKGYGQIHIDYTTRAARQMEREEVPPGYRDYVDQYFRLIRQR